MIVFSGNLNCSASRLGQREQPPGGQRRRHRWGGVWLAVWIRLAREEVAMQSYYLMHSDYMGAIDSAVLESLPGRMSCSCTTLETVVKSSSMIPL